MKRTWLTGAAVALLLAAGPLEAQRSRCYQVREGRLVRCETRDSRRPADPVEMGVRGGYDFDAESPVFGAHVRVPVVRPVALVPSFDVALDDVDSRWQANADLTVKPDRLAGLYAGLGVALARVRDELEDGRETEVGFNVLVGLDGGRFADSRLRPFAEGRWTRIDDDRDAFRLVAGFSVAVSGR